MTNQTRFITAALLTAAFAIAQPRGNRGGGPPDPQQMVERRIEFLADSLGLSDDQKTKATSIFTGAFSASQDARASLRTTKQSMADAVKKNDAGAIDQLSATVGTLTAEITAIDRKAEAAFYTLLTADQQAKYAKTMSRGGPGGFGGGPGGFGRGGRKQ